MLLPDDDISWLRTHRVPELVEAMTGDLLRNHPSDPVAHMAKWLQTHRHGHGHGRHLRSAGGMAGSSGRNLLENVHGENGRQAPRFDADRLRRLSLSEPPVQVLGRQSSLPNLTMRTLGQRDQYFAAHPAFVNKMAELFPGALPEMDFIAKSTKLVGHHGFQKGNAIPLISVCRDELTRSLTDDFEELWGPVFSTGSIAGMVFCGITGFSAGMHHTPDNTDGINRYIFVSAPHIAISSQGEVGKCNRAGCATESTACGALCALLGELKSGTLKVALNTNDMEQSMMKQQLAGLLTYGQVPSLEDLTKLAQKLVKQQVESTLAQLDLKDNTEYVFICGVQVHGPDNANFFWANDFYIRRRDGTRHTVDAKELEQVDATDILEQTYAHDYSRVMAMVRAGDMLTVKQWMQTVAFQAHEKHTT
eukprot:TRINITY_DN3047_c0_g1_i1.p1 TRINITY_DN3047_c0_g1~~TRINITY_DN3047_c0_g1_i1.p1  ORF type:complete len:427 (+),score=133.65 TRINITY_DN3047_c0_g1_i1:23-1282(+)